jgi:hypothetical protein
VKPIKSGKAMTRKLVEMCHIKKSQKFANIAAFPKRKSSSVRIYSFEARGFIIFTYEMTSIL